MKHLLSISQLSKSEILNLIKLAQELKAAKKNGSEKQYLKGKNIALIFEKDSTRTRCAFEVAAADQGAHSTYLGPNGSQIGKKESIRDTAMVLGRMYDGIEYRGFDQSIVETLAKFSGVPVWNGLTDQTHPTQFLADFLTIIEHTSKKIEDIKICFVGTADNNVAMSLMVGCAKVGMKYSAASPAKYFPSMDMVEKLRQEEGADIIITENINQAVAGADFIYTDVWVSMGEAKEIWDERLQLLTMYKVDSAMMKATGNQKCKFLHCLPAFHDLETEVGKMIHEKYGISEMEVSDDVFHSDASIVFDQAENRLHTIKAVMVNSFI